MNGVVWQWSGQLWWSVCVCVCVGAGGMYCTYSYFFIQRVILFEKNRCSYACGFMVVTALFVCDSWVNRLPLCSG